jgi:hypothetical protein
LREKTKEGTESTAKERGRQTAMAYVRPGQRSELEGKREMNPRTKPLNADVWKAMSTRGERKGEEKDDGGNGGISSMQCHD